MSNKSIWDEIKARVKRKEELKKEIAERNANVEAFVLSALDEIDEMLSSTANTSLTPVLAQFYVKALAARIKTLDNGAEIEASWTNPNEDENVRINGILIKWSPQYQVANNCEAQLFVDVANLLFK